MNAMPEVRTRSSRTVYDRIKAIKQAPQLRPALRVLLRSIADYCGDKPECWPSVATLAEECGLTPRYCRQLLRRLESLGWIEHRPRFRSDGSQASSLLVWVAPDATPGTVVPPPRNNSSAHEASSENSTNEKHARNLRECDSDGKDATPPARRSSRRFIVIDNARMRDPQHLREIHEHATAAGIIDKSQATRLAFAAAWCAVVRRSQAGEVKNPGGVLQFLLRRPVALLEYATAADEDKARKAVRHLWPVAAYNPHG